MAEVLGAPTPYLETLMELKVGESTIIADGDTFRARQPLTIYHLKRHKIDITYRSIPGGRVKVWRIQ